MPTFERDVQYLEDELLALADMAERALITSVDTLKQRDLSGAQQLIVLEQQINKKRFAIEMDCLKMIVTQHPTDGHLRTITAILEVATELERITAFASDNVRIPFMAIEQPMLALLVDIQRMALKARDALHRVMQAFVHRDPTAVQTILAEAAGLDALYHEVYQNLLTLIRSSPRTNNSRAVVNQARYLSRVARNLKGAADHVARICRWVASAIPDRMVGARLLPELVPHTA